MTGRYKQSLMMQTLTGRSLEVGLLKLSAGNGQVTLTLQLSFTDWRQAFQEGLFHLDHEEEPTGFKADLPVQLTLRLRPGLEAQQYQDSERISTALQDETSPLRHTEAWLATEMVQDVAVPSGVEGVNYLQMGAKTRWADPTFLPENNLETGTVIERLETFLNDEDWLFARVKERMVRFPAGVGEGKSWVAVAVTDETNETCTLYSIHTRTVPVAQRDNAARWMKAKNRELDQGSFEINPDTGEVCFLSVFAADTRDRITVGLKDNFSVMAAHLDALEPFFTD